MVISSSAGDRAEATTVPASGSRRAALMAELPTSYPSSMAGRGV
jgi:hypothetical protein